MKETWREVFDKTVELVKRLYERDGHLVPVFLLFWEERNGAIWQKTVTVDFGNSEKKVASIAILRQMIKMLKPSFLITVSEAWMKCRKKGEELNTYLDCIKRGECEVKDLPGRQEVIAVILQSRKGDISWTAVVEDKKIVDENVIKPAEMTGNMMKFFDGAKGDFN